MEDAGCHSPWANDVIYTNRMDPSNARNTCIPLELALVLAYKRKYIPSFIPFCLVDIQKTVDSQ